MNRVAVLAAASVLTLGTMPAVLADSGPIGGGTTVTTTLTAPADGATYVAGDPIPVEGVVDLGQGAAVKSTDLVFVLDTSGSTGSSSGLSCGTILACEKTATQNVIAANTGVRSPIAAVGVVAFPSSAQVPLVAPSAFNNSLSAFTASGGTQFDLGMERARAMMVAPGTAANDVMVLMTDGEGDYDDSGQDFSGIVIKAFAIAGAGCNDPELQQAVAEGAPGSECVVVANLTSLPSVVADTIDSSLTSVDVTVDGAVVETLPVAAQGQSSTPFATTVSLPAGDDQVVCAVANAVDAGGAGSVSDCATVDVLPAGTVVVDCTGTAVCTGTATDPGRSDLVFTAPGDFDEVVTIQPGVDTPTDCGGQPCRTGYHVGFPTNDPNGPIATLSVTTTDKVSLADRLRAAVYIDGTRITAQCNNRRLIAGIRNLLGIPEPTPCITIQYVAGQRLEYFLKFNADPKIVFR